ncbi:MAG: transglutaminase-like domain-containing protein [Candidatus Bathyarchaeota archaeon]|nr:transglutaminase-like domain-containing protein [Candidatus Bathyarchaeota archaeon]
MNRTFKVATVLFVALTLISQSLVSFPYLVAVDSGFLKYKVTEVFVGDFRHKIVIQNFNEHRIDDLKLFVPLLTNETARYYVFLSDISAPRKYDELLNDSYGNLCGYWKNLVVNVGENITVELCYKVLSYGVRYTVDPGKVGSYQPESSFYKNYTQPELRIESDNPEIVSKAQSLVGNVADPHEKASLIYNYVVKHLRYARQEEEKGALWALRNEVGDCSEFSYLFVALCRAAGIPSRIKTGFVFHSAPEVLEDGHMWAEYYLGNYGWIPVDAAWKQFDRIDARHFSTMQSIAERIPYTNYYFSTKTYLVLEDKQTLILTPSSPSLFGDADFASNITETLQEMKQIEIALFLATMSSGGFLFPSESQKILNTFEECRIGLQQAIEQKNNLKLSEVSQKTKEISPGAWMLLLKTLIMLAFIFTIPF